MYHKRLQALTCFFVFNPTLAKKETDDETKKILYYFPSKNVPPSTQCAYVGLVSGIVNFSKDFASEPAHALHTERNRYVFDEVEKDIWMCLVLKNPRKDVTTDKYGRRTLINDDNYNNNKSNESDSDLSLSLTSEYYMEDELEDSVLHTIIKSSYSTFVFFHGTFDHNVMSDGINKLRESLKSFFKYYLATIQFHQLRYYADIYGFRFFAVDRSTYLTLQYLNNIVSAEFVDLHSLCVMYCGKLIWSGLDMNDMRVLYTNNQEPNDEYIYTFMAKKGRTNINIDIQNDEQLNGEFLTGPKSKSYFSQNSPIVYLSAKNRFYRLIVYKLRKLKLFWFCDDDTIKQPLNSSNDDLYNINNLDLDCDITKQLEMINDDNNNDPLTFNNNNNNNNNDIQNVLQFYNDFQKFIEPNAEEILKELERHELRQNRKQNKQHNALSNNFRFLYFNHQNLALKSILKAPGKKLSSDICRTLRNIHSDFELKDANITEVCAKCNDGWIVAIKSDFAQRELYLLVDINQATELKDLQKHLDAIKEEYFTNVFML